MRLRLACDILARYRNEIVFLGGRDKSKSQNVIEVRFFVCEYKLSRIAVSLLLLIVYYVYGFFSPFYVE